MFSKSIKKLLSWNVLISVFCVWIIFGVWILRVRKVTLCFKRVPKLRLKNVLKLTFKIVPKSRFKWIPQSRFKIVPQCGKVKYVLRVASYKFKYTWVTISNLRVTSSTLRVTSSYPRITRSNSRVTSSNPRVANSNLRVTSSNSRVRRLKHELQD